MSHGGLKCCGFDGSLLGVKMEYFLAKVLVRSVHERSVGLKMVVDVVVRCMV
jgi:hypothetical protein